MRFFGDIFRHCNIWAELTKKLLGISHYIISQNLLNIIALVIRIWYYNVSEVMYMIKIAVVDDEKIVLNQVSQLIKNTIDEEVILDNFESSTCFFQRMDKLLYDIVFLDIDMPEITGFELAETLRCVKPNITIVFVSNLEHLAFRSFHFKPFGFIRKSDLQEDINFVIYEYKKELSKIREIYFFKTTDAEGAVPVSEIIYFESMGHDIYLQTIDNKYKLKREREKELSMKTLSDQFSKKGFIRIHKSFLVNFRHIYKINKNNIELKKGKAMDINPHKVKEIREKFQYFSMMEG